MSFLFDIKREIIKKFEDSNALNKMYFQEAKVPTEKDFKIEKIDSQEILDLIGKNGENISKFIEDIKIHVSKLEYDVPLYDALTENLYLIKNVNVYKRVMFQHYRFPDSELLKTLTEIVSITPVKNLTDDLDIRKIRKFNLILDFMNNFDIGILENTYYTVMYKYSVELGKDIVFCRRPSFNKYIVSSKPYYSRSEIINMALNMDVEIPHDMYVDKKEVLKLCSIVSKNDLSYTILMNHKIHIVNNDSLGLIQYYTIQGSYFINNYLRNVRMSKTDALSRNPFLDSIILPLWKLCIDAPEFDKNYTLYRFISNDKFLTKYKVGDIFTEPGFMSTTRDPFYRSDVYQFGFILIKIKIPEGIKGVALCLETISHFPEEQEIIFPPNSQFKIINKDEKCKYFHTDQNRSSQIKTRYEFEWISNNKDIMIDKKEMTEQNKELDFLELKNDDDMISEKIFSMAKYDMEPQIKNHTIRVRQPIQNTRSKTISVNDKINIFTQKLNSLNQFVINIGGSKLVNVVEKYDSTGAYKNFYAIKNITDGFSIYCIHNGYFLYFIEIGDRGNGPEMHVNYYVKYNTLEKSSLLSDEDLLLFISTVAHYFEIQDVVIYAEYMACTGKSNDYIKNMRNFGQRGFTTNKAGLFETLKSQTDVKNEDIGNEIETEQKPIEKDNLPPILSLVLKKKKETPNTEQPKRENIKTLDRDIAYTGNFCLDFYEYLKKKKKRFSTASVSSFEIVPKFSYYDLDYLKNISVKKILAKDDRDEIYQTYEKIYKKETDTMTPSVTDFILWVIENRCYLIDFLIPKISRIYGDRNPFDNDMYLLNPNSYLYNRKYIKTYTATFQNDIFSPREVYNKLQKNEYRNPPRQPINIFKH